MANESNEKKAEGKVELSLDELEGAAGGYILYRPGGSAPTTSSTTRQAMIA